MGGIRYEYIEEFCFEKPCKISTVVSSNAYYANALKGSFT